MKNGNLTFKQEKFIYEYLADFNATQAAIRAGYSPKWANKTGPELLKNKEIQYQIKNVKESITKKQEIKLESIINELREIAFNLEPSFIDICSETNTFVLKAPNNIKDIQLIESVSSSSNGFSIKLKSKIKALELLMKLIDFKKPSVGSNSISRVLDKLNTLKVP